MIETGDNLYALFSRYASKTNIKQGLKIEISSSTSEFPETTESHQEVGNANTYLNAPEQTVCECTKKNRVKCITCIERDSLRCNFCPMVFVEKADIERHLTACHTAASANVEGEVSVTASVGENYDDKSLTEANPKISEENEQNLENKAIFLHQCKICFKVCLSFRGLTRHSVVHKNAVPPKLEVTTISCDFCQQTFANTDDKNTHCAEYHRITLRSGEDDGQKVVGRLRSADDLEPVKVDEEKENIKGFKASEVDGKEVTVTEKKTTKRKAKKSEESVIKAEFTCDECGKSFEKKSSYVRHKQTHNISSEFTCDICQKQFSSETVLKRHKTNVHRNKRVKLSEEEDPFSKWYVFADGQKHLKCDQCKYNSLWYHKGRFLEHYRIHTGEKPFTCDSCGKQFRTKTLLQKHVMFVHEGIKEHPCDICGRCFSDKRYMEDHRRIHTGERPYVCDLCGKTFKQSASLFIHKELHKGLRKHGCEMCGKRFTTRSSLTIHIKRHVGERNFICATCGKAFVDGKHLKDHMAVHSEERPFSCELCGGRFKLMKHLKQHGRTHKRDYNV